MKTRIFLVAVFCLVTGSIRDGDEDETFIVVRASPNTTNQLDYVRELHDNMHTYDLDFWLTPHAVGHFADVMVRESKLPWLRDQLALHGINHFVSVADVQKLIIDREQKGKSKNLRFMQILNDFRKRYKDEGGNKARYGFGDYHSYEVITNWMHEIERQYPDRAKVISIGETDEKRPIKTIKLGTNIQSTSKRVIWIDGGIHAREWAAVHTTNYFIDRLIADYDTDPLVREAMDNLHFYVTPVMNPDGYEYSRTGVSPMIRLWRKNRSNMVCKKDRWFRDRCCGGVDLNRNFDWFWGEIGSSSDRCSEIYQGSDVWSEAESRAVRDMMFSPELRGKVDAFITLHTYSQMWIHPFSHQRKTVPEDIADTEEVGRKAVSALEAMYGTKYRFGTGADILYPSSGGSDDWAKGKGGAKYVYLLELRPGEEVWDGFILDSRQLMPTAKETWAGVKVVIDAVLKRLRRVPTTSSTTTSTTTTTTSTTTTTQAPTTTTKRIEIVRPRVGFRTRSRVRPVVMRPEAARQLLAERFRQQHNNLVAENSSRRNNLRRGQNNSRFVSGNVQNTAPTLVEHFPQQTSVTSPPPIQQPRPQQALCLDKSPWCGAWIKGNANICQISSVYMRRDCARACRYCS